MSFSLLLLLLAATPRALPAPAAESQGVQFLRAEFERIGRRAPARDSALDEAARTLATVALRTGAKEAGDLVSMTLAISAAGGHDPTPRAVLLSGPKAETLKTLLNRKELARDPATHLGMGAAQSEDDQLSIVVLLADRKASLPPFPRRVDPGARQELCGDLQGGLASAEVFVTRPQGSVERIRLSTDKAQRFCAKITFPGRGRHQVEVIGRGEKGPEIAALFYVQSGGLDPEEIKDRPAEPAKAWQAAEAILDRTNALRRVHGAGALRLVRELNEVAQAYSDRMAKELFFAHVDPQGGDLKKRLMEAGIPFMTAGENLGLADGPLAAHFGIELSPGHRRNLLDPAFEQMGVGIAFREVDGKRQAVVTEVLARPLSELQDPLRSAYRAISQARTAQNLSPLEVKDTLEKVALEQAKALVKADNPHAEGSDQIHQKVFEVLPEARTVAVDVFVADSPGQVPRSGNLQDPKSQWVGVGAVRAQSKRYGAGRYWVVVIYATAK